MKFVLLILFFFPSFLRCQFLNDSLLYFEEYPQNSYNSVFNKNLTTYTLKNDFDYSGNLLKYSYKVDGSLKSTIVKSVDKNIKDDFFFNFSNSYKLDEKIRTGFILQNLIFSDSRQSTNQVSDFSGILFTAFTPIDIIKLTPFIGYGINEQSNIKENGYRFGVKLNSEYRESGSFKIQGNIKSDNYSLKNRNNYKNQIDVEMKNDFNEGFGNISAFNYIRKRNDFFSEADSILNATYDITKNIESRFEENTNISNTFSFYSPDNFINLELTGGLEFRAISRERKYNYLINGIPNSFNSGIDKFALNFISSSIINYDNYSFSFLLTFREDEEEYYVKESNDLDKFILEERNILERRKNNKSSLIMLNLSTNIKISNSIFFNTSLFTRKLIYDTPSELNNDDRDELLMGLNSSVKKIFTKNFYIDSEINLSTNKLVYIYSEKSINNNIRRLIKLKTSGYLTSKHFDFIGRTEISANYTSYDYEKISSSVKSYSYRQFSNSDSLLIKFNKNDGLAMHFLIKLSEQGSFNWDNFTSSPQRFTEEFTTGISGFINFRNYYISTGIRIFNLNSYNYNSNFEKILIGKYFSYGPLVNCVYEGKNSRIALEGLIENITFENKEERQISTINLLVNYYFY